MTEKTAEKPVCQNGGKGGFRINVTEPPGQNEAKTTVIRHYIKPPLGERRLVYILDIRQGIACWLPGLRRTLYMETAPESNAFKRVRPACLVEIYDWADTEKGIVELTEKEYREFQPVYETYLRTGGEIYYFREKRSRKIWHSFEIRPGERKDITKLRKSLLSEKM